MYFAKAEFSGELTSIAEEYSIIIIGVLLYAFPYCHSG